MSPVVRPNGAGSALRSGEHCGGNGTPHHDSSGCVMASQAAFWFFSCCGMKKPTPPPPIPNAPFRHSHSFTFVKQWKYFDNRKSLFSLHPHLKKRKPTLNDTFLPLPHPIPIE